MKGGALQSSLREQDCDGLTFLQLLLLAYLQMPPNEAASGGGGARNNDLRELPATVTDAPLRRARALLALMLIVASIPCTALMFSPLLLFLPIHYTLYRWATSTCLAVWQAFAAACVELVAGVRVVADPFAVAQLREQPRVLLIANHRTRLDWLLLWPLLARAGRLRELHICLKRDVGDTPFAGWALSAARYPLLTRSWALDAARWAAALRLIATGSARASPYSGSGSAALPPRRFVLLLFPEGVDLQARSLAASDAFAAAQGLERRTFTLHPRARGMAHVLATLEGATGGDTVVVDATLGYEPSRALLRSLGAAAADEPAVAACVRRGSGPHVPQSEAHLTGLSPRAALPGAVHVHVHSWSARALFFRGGGSGSSSSSDGMPGGGAALEERVGAWLSARFREKEAALAAFYDRAASGVSAVAVGAASPHMHLLVGDAHRGGTAPRHRPSPPPWRVYVPAALAQVLITRVALAVVRFAPVYASAWIAAYCAVFALLAPRIGGWDSLELRIRGASLDDAPAAPIVTPKRSTPQPVPPPCG